MWKKMMTVDGQEYEVRIRDYCCGRPGWFDVRVYEGKKRFLESPVVNFTTFDDPEIVAMEQITHYQNENKEYRDIINKLNGVAMSDGKND